MITLMCFLILIMTSCTYEAALLQRIGVNTHVEVHAASEDHNVSAHPQVRTTSHDEKGFVLGDYVKLYLLLTYTTINSSDTDLENKSALCGKRVIIAIYNVTYSVLGERPRVHYVVRSDFAMLVTETRINEEDWLNITIWAPLWKERTCEGLWVYPNTYYNITIVLEEQIHNRTLYYLLYHDLLDGRALCTLNGTSIQCYAFLTRFTVKALNGWPVRQALVRVDQRLETGEWFRIALMETDYRGRTDEILFYAYYVTQLTYVPGKVLHIGDYVELSGEWSLRVIISWRGIEVFEALIPVKSLAECN